MTTKHEHAEHPVYLVFMLVLSALSLIALAVSTRGSLDPEQRRIMDFADNAICVLFLVDFLYSMHKAPRPLRYFMKWGWLDLLSAMPMLDVLRTTRLARILRIVRLIRGIRATKIMAEFILTNRARSAFLAVSLLSVLLVVVSSIGILQFEGPPDSNIRTAGDALWWAVATVTTVGYGDKFPVTPEGRIIASFLMVCGVGLFGTLSGFVASWFLRPSHDEHEGDLAVLTREVREMRAELQALGARVPKPD
jgi:voltage-gated potassium channel